MQNVNSFLKLLDDITREEEVPCRASKILKTEVKRKDKLEVKIYIPGVEKKDVTMKTAGSVVKLEIGNDEYPDKLEFDLEKLNTNEDKNIVLPPENTLRLGVLTISCEYKNKVEEQICEIKD